jgi:diguanylate cyclase (GGDEF)-like protein/PAS domain S-box-containing protein
MLGILSVAALAATVFPLAFSPFAEFFPAGIAILLTVRLYGTRWGLVAALLSAVCTFVLRNDLAAALLYISEALVIGMLLQRGLRSLLCAAVVFWVFFGLPLMWLNHTVILKTDADSLLLPLLSPVANGLFNALAATLLLRFSPLLEWRERTLNTLWETQFNLVMGCFILPVLLIVLLNINSPRDFLRTGLEAEMIGECLALDNFLASRNVHTDNSDRRLRASSDGQGAQVQQSSIDIRSVEHLLREFPRKGSFHITLLDQDGRILASTDPDRVPRDDYFRTPGRSGSAWAADSYLWNPAYQRFTSLSSRGKAPPEPGPDASIFWRTVIELPSGLRFAYLQRTVALGMAIMFLPALLALFLLRNISRKITAPLEELAQVTSKIPERLKADLPIAWPVCGGIEVGSLIRNFRALAEELAVNYKESRKVGSESAKDLDDIMAQRNWEVFTAGRKLRVEMDRRKRIEELLSELEAAESKYRFLVEKTLVGVYFLTGDCLSYVNPRFAEIFGYRPEELMPDLKLIDLVAREDRPLVAGNLRRQNLGEVNNLQFKFRGVRKDGSQIHVEVLSGKGAYKGQTAILGTLMDITARVNAEQTIQHMAYHDPLTGLPNRLLFADRVHQALNFAMRNQQMLGMLFLDLDHFKNVNDTLGHAAGDQLLKSMTGRLQECLRDSDTVGRFGGDEFNVLVTQVKQESDITLVAHKILRAMRFPFHIEEHEIYLTCSIGIALYPKDSQDVHGLVKNADTALYRAKDLGRNNYQVYSPSMNARALERMAMENSLRRVLDRNELRVHYQAQVDLKTGKIVGMEALLRWEHEIGEMIQPSVFIPLAEKIGVIAPIGEWVLRTACHQAKAWQREGFPPLRVGINVSATQLKDPKFAEVVTHIVSESKIDPKWINLEITESVVMDDIKEAVGKFRQLHDVGITVAIDDFGIGYSSLSYLRDFPVDQLKMDRSFVQNLPRQTNDANIARHIVAMAHEVGLSVIAEGIETAEQFEFLKSLGCNEGQGFLLSKPVPPEEFANLLRGEKTFSFASAFTDSALPTETDSGPA